MWKSCQLVNEGNLSADDFAQAVWLHFQSRRPIGELALSKGILSMKQVFEVLGHESAETKQFGEVCIELGYLTRKELAELLLCQEDEATPVETILFEMGAIDSDAFSHLTNKMSKVFSRSN